MAVTTLLRWYVHKRSHHVARETDRAKVFIPPLLIQRAPFSLWRASGNGRLHDVNQSAVSYRASCLLCTQQKHLSRSPPPYATLQFSGRSGFSRLSRMSSLHWDCTHPSMNHSLLWNQHLMWFLSTTTLNLMRCRNSHASLQLMLCGFSVSLGSRYSPRMHSWPAVK